MNSPIRVLFVSHVAELGGGERSLLDLLAALDRRLVSPAVVVPAPGELPAALGRDGTGFEICPHLRRLHRPGRLASFAVEGVHLLLGVSAIQRLVRRLQPRLLHANSTTAALFCLPAALAARRPLIWHCRDLTAPGRLEKMLARRSTAVIVPSQACRAAVEALGGRARIELVPNGIDLGRFGNPEPPAAVVRRELGLSTGPLILTIGQEVVWKRYDLLLEAARLVLARNPSVRFLLLLDRRLGGDAGLGARLRRSIEDPGLADAVRLLDAGHDVARLLAAADVLVHPAFPEPFGRVVVEAMAAGRPVVAFAGDHGPGEIIRDGVDGCLAAPRTAAALAERLLDLLERPEAARAMGAIGRERAAALYGRDLMARRIEEVYRALVHEG